MSTCIDPQALEEGQLQAYAADPGMTDSAVSAHLQACPACQAEVHAMRSLAAHLRRDLNRTDCLSTEAIIGLAAGDLPRVARIAAEAHTARCHRCAEELALTVAAFTQLEPLLAWAAPGVAQQLAARARRVVAKLVDALAPSSPDVALGLNLRSRGTDASADPLLFAAEDVMLAVRGQAATLGTVQIEGLLSSATEDAIATESLPVRLYALSDPAAPALVAEDTADGGIFLLGPIPAGKYALEVDLPDRIVAIESLIV